VVVVVVDGAAGPVKPNVPDRNLLVLVGGPLPLLHSCFVAMIVNGVNVLSVLSLESEDDILKSMNTITVW